MKKIILGLFLFFANLAISQVTANDCQRLHHCKLKYIGDFGQSYFEINGSEHLEYETEGGPFIKSTLIWNSECEYTAKVTEVTLGGGLIKVGDELTAKILKIENNFVYLKVTFDGVAFEFKYEILEYF